MTSNTHETLTTSFMSVSCRHTHDKLAEILAAQQPHESLRSALQSVDDFFPVVHPTFAQPSAHVLLEGRGALVMIVDDESLHLHPLAQHRRQQQRRAVAPFRKPFEVVQAMRPHSGTRAPI